MEVGLVMVDPLEYLATQAMSHEMWLDRFCGSYPAELVKEIRTRYQKMTEEVVDSPDFREYVWMEKEYNKWRKVSGRFTNNTSSLRRIYPVANEIQVSFRAATTCYFLVRNRIGQVWNTSALAFQTYVTATYANYTISLTEQGTASSYFAGNFPTAITAGVYSVTAKQQIGGSPAESDPTIAVGDLQWNGTVTLPLSDLASSGQIGQIGPVRIARGVQLLNFPFKLVSSADHSTPFTSGVVSGQISRDGAAFGALQSGAYTEIGLGWYSLQALTSGDLNANTVALTLSANGISGGQADQRDFALITQRVSGSV